MVVRCSLGPTPLPFPPPQAGGEGRVGQTRGPASAAQRCRAASRPGHMKDYSLAGARERLIDLFPIDQVIPERLKVLRTSIAVINVIRVLPHVATEDRSGALHQRAFAVRCLV